ncbi:MAG: LamG-like jellyroll fold domain-containing protein, partial [Planctomycetota bacterium]
YNNTVYITRETKGAAIADLPYTEGASYVYNTEVYNNIFFSAAGKQVVDIPQPSGGWSFRGNCYWTYGGDIEIKWGDATYTSLNEWRVATGQERFGGVDIGYQTDPKLIDAGAGGTVGDVRLLSTLNAYRLTALSPLIDAGLDIESAFGIDAGGQDYYGTKIPGNGKYDVGAHEFDKAQARRIPLCWWKFDEGAGAVATNSGSLGHKADGVLKQMGESPWVQGRAEGTGLYFGGDANRVEVPALNLNSNTVTITAWIKRDGEQGTYSVIVLSRAGATTAGLTFGSTGEESGWQPNNALSYNWNDANQAWAWQSGLVVPNDKWVFVGLVVEQDKASLYLGDGGTVKSAVNNTSHAIEEFNGIVLIGKDSYHDYEGHKSFKGVIDDVRIYNRALSEEQILVLAGAPKLDRVLATPGKYYVSPSGDDGNSGRAPKQAWKTISKVNSIRFQAGDSILFEGGKTFHGSLRFDTADSGTRANPVMVGSYGQGHATISSGVEHGLFAKNVSAFEVRNLVFVGAGSDVEGNFSGIYFLTDLGGDVKLEHIRLDNVEVSGYRQRGILIDARGSGRSGFKDVRITNADIHGNGDRGITSSGSRPRVGWNHEDIYVGNCKIYDNLGFSDPLHWGHHGNGIVLSSVDGAVIEYCQAYNNGQLSDTKGGGPVGIWAYDSNEVVIQFCEAHHNKTSGGDGGGFDLDGGCLNSVMQYNYSHDNHGSGYLICQYDGARPFKNNVCRYNITENDGIACAYPMGSIHFWSAGTSGGIQDTAVYGNTVYASRATRGAAIEIDSGFIYNTSVYNNIFMTAPGRLVVDAADTPGTWAFKGNCYWSSGTPLQIVWGDKNYASLAEWRAGTGQEMRDGKPVGFEADPQLVNAGGGGTIGDIHQLASLKAYRLRSSSPLIDAGLDIEKLFRIDIGQHDYYGTKIPSGGKLDIGAHEYSNETVCNGPVGWWKFDRPQERIAGNSGSLGNSADGTLNNMGDAAWVDGISGKALNFDGKDDDVSVGPLNLNSNTVTISAWIRRNGRQDVYAGIVYSRDGDTIAGIGSGSTGEPDWQGNHELFYTWNDTEDTWAWHSGLIIPDKQWVFVALVLEPTGATLYLGKDGKLTSATNSVNHAIEEFNGATRIGHDKKPDFPPRFFKGLIDDVRVYDRALSSAEIAKLAELSE